MVNDLVLALAGVSIHYPGQKNWAVEKVSFEVNSGSITTIIGPNGSGKSTLIKAILGLMDYEGEILVWGKAVEQVYKRIGFVPQRYEFDRHFPVSVAEFVGMPVLDPRSKKQQITQALKAGAVEKLKDKLLDELSGGQLQRVLLARALVNQPDLLVLDEPEAGVDVGGEQNLYDLLESLVKERNLTVLVASHELDVVYTYADQVLCLNRRMVCSGKPREVLKQSVFEELYGRELKFYGHTHGKRDRE